MGVRLIYSLSFIFCLETIKGLSGDTCYNGDAQVCCPNFQNENGICKECQNGTTSQKDSNCSRCIPGWYGYKCSTPCDCPIDRCDHVKGCVQRTSTAETTLNAVPFSTVVTVSFGTPQPDSVTIKDNTRITSSTGVLLSSSQPGSVTENTSIKSSTEIIIYCASVGCLLLVMCLGFAYQRYRLKQQSEKLLQLTKVNSVNLLTDDIYTESGEEHYQYIDESRMVDSKVDPEPSGGYLEVVDSSSDTSIQHNIDEGYLHPYNALSQPTEADVHVYSQKSNKHKSISSGSNASLPYTDQQGYFHMYQQLGERCKSLPQDYESTNPHSHNHSLNCQSDGKENNISSRNSKTLYEQQHIVERTQPQCMQEAKQLLLKNKGLFSHAQNISSDHQTKKNLTL